MTPKRRFGLPAFYAGKIGCYPSHPKVWGTIATGAEPMAAILEDGHSRGTWSWRVAKLFQLDTRRAPDGMKTKYYNSVLDSI